MWKCKRSFLDPFTRNHCVVLTLAELAGMGTEDAMALAELAVETRLLTKSGLAFACIARFDEWLDAAGLTRFTFPLRPSYRPTGSLAHPRPQMSLGTLTTFAREHPQGRWFLRVSHHAVALIDGMLLGSYRTGSRVTFAQQVTLAKEATRR